MAPSYMVALSLILLNTLFKYHGEKNEIAILKA